MPDDLAAILEEMRQGERAAPRTAMRRLLAAIDAVLEKADEAIPAVGAIHCTCAGNGADDTCRCPERPVAWTLDPAKLRETIRAALAGKDAGDA
jgi:hypothetical protein